MAGLARHEGGELRRHRLAHDGAAGAARERDGRRIGARPVAGVDRRAIRRRHIVRIEDVLHAHGNAVEWTGRAFEFRGEAGPGPDLGLALRDALAAACEQRLGGALAALDQSCGLLRSQTKSVRHWLSIIAAFACNVETSSSLGPVTSARSRRWRARDLAITSRCWKRRSASMTARAPRPRSRRPSRSLPSSA